MIAVLALDLDCARAAHVQRMFVDPALDSLCEHRALHLLMLAYLMPKHT